MPKNDIGGFFVSLGLDTDKNSFETGIRLIDGVANGFNKLIGAARNAAVVMVSAATASGVVASQEIKTAETLGTTTENLNKWKAAAKIAGVDSNALVGTISKLANVLNHIDIDAAGVDAYSEQLGKLQIGFDELEGMDPGDAVAKIIATAQSKLDGTPETKLRLTAIVGDILGDAGQQLFVDLQRQGLSIYEFLNGAQKTQFETREDKENAAGFLTEVRTITEETKSLVSLFGDNMAKELTPLVRDIKEWMLKHGPEIAEKIRDIAEDTGALVNKIVGAAQKVKEKVDNTPVIKETGKAVLEGPKVAWEGTKQMASQIAQGDWKGAGQTYLETGANVLKPVTIPIKAGAEVLAEKYEEQEKAELGMDDEQYASYEEAQQEIKALWKANNPRALFPTDWNKLPYESLNIKTQKLIDKYGGKENFKWIKDGIIRPDGTVTQVAPDDWVFAARNLGDLARAFIPQGAGTQIQAPSEYVINQTFNITGSNDIPQVLKAQAYRGTQEGLMDLMAQSSRRLEMMSGTR